LKNHGQVFHKISQVSKNFRFPMKIEQWPIDKPQPYPRNARKISDLAVEKVGRSIKDFGWPFPLLRIPLPDPTATEGAVGWDW
jgi:hypothetical protein